jgi:hypothetical protein
MMAENGSLRMSTVISIGLPIIGMAFAVGLFAQRLYSHEDIEVHRGAVRRAVYDRELMSLRERVALMEADIALLKADALRIQTGGRDRRQPEP